MKWAICRPRVTTTGLHLNNPLSANPEKMPSSQVLFSKGLMGEERVVKQLALNGYAVLAVVA